MDIDSESAQPKTWRENPVWQLYLQYGRENTGYAALGIGTTLAGRVFGLVPAFIIGLTVDAIFLTNRAYRLPLVPSELIPRTPTGLLSVSVGVLLGATLLGAITSWVEDWGWSVFAQRIQHGLRVDTYARLQQLDMAYFTGQRTGELISILNSDVNALETFLEDGLSSVFWVTATFVGIGGILLTLNLPLALVTLLPIPFLAGFTLLFTRII